MSIGRSSHRRCSIKQGVLKNFIKFTGKHLCWSLFFNKVAGLSHRCFPVNSADFLRIPFSAKRLSATTSSSVTKFVVLFTSNVKAEFVSFDNALLMVIIGDFNGKYKDWYSNAITSRYLLVQSQQ